MTKTYNNFSANEPGSSLLDRFKQTFKAVQQYVARNDRHW